VWLYLWTKSIGAGVVMVAALLGRIGLAVSAIGLAFTVITTALLVFDLKRPERFWYLLVKPNFRSWLVWGGYVLGLFATYCTVAWALPHWTHAFGIALGALTAGYSAFLFNQAEGRDFWQSPMLLWHLIVEAAVCGSAALLLLGERGPLLTGILAAGLALTGLFIMGELLERHGNADVRKASLVLLRRRSFWIVVVALGIVAPLGLLALGVPAAAAVLALAGALEYGRLWIVAGQSVKLS
jgi:formate-dependent nitrite reductase membrane component NrfD